MSSSHVDPQPKKKSASPPRRAAAAGADDEAAPTPSNLQSGPCDLLRISKSRSHAPIAHYITSQGDKVVHFSCEANEVMDSALIPRIIATTERAVYKFPMSAASSSSSDIGAASSFSFEQRRFPIADLSELVAIDGCDGDLQGHGLHGLDVQVFGMGGSSGGDDDDGEQTTRGDSSSSSAHKVTLKFVLNFGDLTARRQAFLLNISMVQPELPIMQKQRIKKLAAHQQRSSPQQQNMESAMKDEVNRGSPSRLVGSSSSQSPSRQTDNGGNWMSPDALKATAAEKRREAAARARAAKKAAGRNNNNINSNGTESSDAVFNRLYEPSKSRSDSDQRGPGQQDNSSSPLKAAMAAPSAFNNARRDWVQQVEERRAAELPIQLQPEFYAHIRQQQKQQDQDDDDDAQQQEQQQQQPEEENAAGARTLLQSEDTRVLLPPTRELDDNDFASLRAAIHSDLLSERADFTRRDGKGYPTAVFSSSGLEKNQPPTPRARSRTIISGKNASFDGRPAVVEHTELSPERAAERLEIRLMLRAREEALDLDARFRETYTKKPLTKFDGHVPTFDKSHAERHAPHEPSDEELLGPSLFPLWKHWKEVGGLLQVLKDQRRLARINAGTGKVKYSSLDDDDFDLCWTLFDSQDLIASLKSQERELLGQVGRGSIERLKKMRELVEREKRMYENSTGKSIAKSPGGDASPLSSRLAAYAPPPTGSSPDALMMMTTTSPPLRGKYTKPDPFRLSLSPSLEGYCNRRLAVDDNAEEPVAGSTDKANVIASPSKKGVAIRLFDRDTVGDVMARVAGQLNEKRKAQIELAELTRPGHKKLGASGASPSKH